MRQRVSFESVCALRERLEFEALRSVFPHFGETSFVEVGVKLPFWRSFDSIWLASVTNSFNVLENLLSLGLVSRRFVVAFAFCCSFGGSSLSFLTSSNDFVGHFSVSMHQPFDRAQFPVDYRTRQRRGLDGQGRMSKAASNSRHG